MGKYRAFLPRRKTRWPVDRQEETGMAYGLYETAWADAWPHLQDWFMPEAFFIRRGRVRPGIA